MTLHRLWTQTTPPFAKFSDGQVGMTIGNAFYVVGVSGWTCRGARVFWPAGATVQTLTVYAWNADPGGTNGPLTLAQSATVQVVPGQWNEVVWPAPVPMSSAVPIWLGYSSQTYDDYIAWTGAPSPAVGADDASPVYLAGSTEFSGRGRYVYARNTMPTNTLSFSAGVDIIADDGLSTSAFSGSVALSGAGSLSATRANAVFVQRVTATSTPARTLAVSGTGSLTAAGAPAATVSLARSGTGSLTAAGAPAATAQISVVGAGSLTTSASPSVAGTYTASGSGVLVVTSTPGLSFAATLGGSGALSLAGAPAATGSSFLGGSSALALSGQPGISVLISLSGTGTIAGTGAKSGVASVDLSGSGSLLLSGKPGASALSSRTGSGVLSPTGLVGVQGALFNTGSGTLSLSGARGSSGSFSLSGTAEETLVLVGIWDGTVIQPAYAERVYDGTP